MKKALLLSIAGMTLVLSGCFPAQTPAPVIHKIYIMAPDSRSESSSRKGEIDRNKNGYLHVKENEDTED